MRKIGIPEIEDIATGAALLGAGGGDIFDLRDSDFSHDLFLLSL